MLSTLSVLQKGLNDICDHMIKEHEKSINEPSSSEPLTPLAYPVAEAGAPEHLGADSSLDAWVDSCASGLPETPTVSSTITIFSLPEPASDPSDTEPEPTSDPEPSDPDTADTADTEPEATSDADADPSDADAEVTSEPEFTFQFTSDCYLDCPTICCDACCARCTAESAKSSDGFLAYCDDYGLDYGLDYDLDDDTDSRPVIPKCRRITFLTG